MKYLFVLALGGLASLPSCYMALPARTLEPGNGAIEAEGRKYPATHPHHGEEGDADYVPRRKQPSKLKKTLRKAVFIVADKLEDVLVPANKDPGPDPHRDDHPPPLKPHPYDDRIVPAPPKDKSAHKPYIKNVVPAKKNFGSKIKDMAMRKQRNEAPISTSPPPGVIRGSPSSPSKPKKSVRLNMEAETLNYKDVGKGTQEVDFTSKPKPYSEVYIEWAKEQEAKKIEAAKIEADRIRTNKESRARADAEMREEVARMANFDARMQRQ